MRFAYLIEPPFNFTTPDGDVTGHDVEIARAVCTALGHSFEPIETTFAQLLPGLKQGRWQMTTGLFDTPERRKAAQFTRPVWALPDGLLVKEGNPLGVTGYGSLAAHQTAILAVIRDQFQHRSAVHFGVPQSRLLVFETYAQAAAAVVAGQADAYASVARAHSGFTQQNQTEPLEVVDVPVSEKPPAFGAFAVGPQADELLTAVNRALDGYLGSPQHRTIAATFGFSDSEIDLVAGPKDVGV